MFLGLGIGSSRVKLVSTDHDFASPQAVLREHLGNPRDVALEMLSTVDPSSVSGLAVTGGEGASLVDGRKICECEALEETLKLLGIQADSVLSLGGESFVAYPLDSSGRVLDCLSGNKCAAGTVEFFRQQLGRMSLGIDEATRMAGDGKVVPLAKRCSVHCKSDCTHALNKNRCTVTDIVHTLCHNMAEKAVGLLQNAALDKGKVLVIGGASANGVVVDYIRKFLPACEVSVPPHAEYFEALGAAASARDRSLPVPLSWPEMFRKTQSSFAFLNPLRDYADMVESLPPRNGTVRQGRRYLLGIDGGSTTTKAALVDAESLEICASRYVRTNGNPEKAMKECLVAVKEQADAAGVKKVQIVGVATTGSSGEILSVLCETPAYHNEIIAHAYGSSYFCPGVDTIFEIGGQDSKFTSLRSNVAVDFNMNESCSAGTGSFIEESAKDDLGVKMEEIAELALRSEKPPRFSDQCAAFANTDIRQSSQEGASREDNLAGLVYAIVENYVSKVVGHRKIGDNVLFQGGTSKNRAIAYAFAAKTGKRITVPPNSELVGCFGIALWLREKIRSGDIPEMKCRLEDILGNTITGRQDFTCKSCDNFCSVQNLTVNGRKYTFGGQCSKWENARNRKTVDTAEFDFVAKRNAMLFREYGVEPGIRKSRGKVMGMQAVFSIFTYYPLYSRFFDALGYDIELSETVDPHGVRMCQSTRCYPYEIAHGTFCDLVKKGVKNIFVPHVCGMPGDKECTRSTACPIAQGTSYYLAATFPDADVTIHNPVLDMTDGIEDVEDAFVELGMSLGHAREDSRRAFRHGHEVQKAYAAAAKREGRKVLEQLDDEDRTGLALVGRPYNAFSKTANMGVPRKFASRGVPIIPFEFLPFEDEAPDPTMYWAYGQKILKSLKYIRKHPRLFPVYLSNYGCGPDSFVQHFAASIMGRKPMLYLELDSHTADAGIGTRTAAFLDIISGYRKLGGTEEKDTGAHPPAEFVLVKGKPHVRTSGGELLRASDPRVTLAFPSMGRLVTEACAASSSAVGWNAIALPPVDDRVLAVGKSYTSGKECSPAVFTVGALMDYYLNHHKKKSRDEVLLFFMPTASGPCRFGQYNVYMKELVKALGMEDVAIFAPTAVDGYAGMGWRLLRMGWLCFVLGDLMRDIRAVLKVAAEDRDEAMRAFEVEWRRLLAEGISSGYASTWRVLEKAAQNLERIPLKRDPHEVPKVLLTGEIYVRSDGLSRRAIEDFYADEGLMLKIADSTEWIYYVDWDHLRRLAGGNLSPRKIMAAGTLWKEIGKAVAGRRKSRDFVAARLKYAYKRSVETKARKILAKSGLLVTGQHHVDHVVEAGCAFLRPALAGEAILTSGSTKLSFGREATENYCGVVFIGPFNCMPTGVAESVTKPYARANGIPLLAFETDGSPMTPNFKGQMEVHLLRSRIYAGEQLSTGRKNAS